MGKRNSDRCSRSRRHQGRERQIRNHTANSSRAAELLRNRNAGTLSTASEFLKSTVSGMTCASFEGIPIVEGIYTVEILIRNTHMLKDAFDSRYGIALKLLRKKDRRSKRKGARQFRELMEIASDKEMSTMLRPFVQEYSRLVLDIDVDVREEMNKVLVEISGRMKRKLAPHLKFLVPHWFLSQHDISAKAANSAVTAYHMAFPEGKRVSVLLYSINSVVDVLSSNLYAEPGTFVSVGYSNEEANEKYQLVVYVALMSLAELVSILSQREEKKYVSLLSSRIPDMGAEILTKHFYGDNIRIKLALLSLVKSLNTHASEEILPSFENWFLGVSYTLSDRKLNSTLPLETMRSFFVTFKDFPGGESNGFSTSQESLLARFTNVFVPFLQNGCYNVEGAFSEVVKLIEALPVSLLENQTFAGRILAGMWEGKDLVHSNNVDALIDALCQLASLFRDKWYVDCADSLNRMINMRDSPSTSSMQTVLPAFSNLFKYLVFSHNLKMNTLTSLRSHVASLYSNMAAFCKGHEKIITDFHRLLLSDLNISEMDTLSLERLGKLLGLIPFSVKKEESGDSWSNCATEFLVSLVHELIDILKKPPSDSRFETLILLSELCRVHGLTFILSLEPLSLTEFLEEVLVNVTEKLLELVRSEAKEPQWFTGYLFLLRLAADVDPEATVNLVKILLNGVEWRDTRHISMVTRILKNGIFPKEPMKELSTLFSKVSEMLTDCSENPPAESLDIREEFVEFVCSCLGSTLPFVSKESIQKCVESATLLLETQVAANGEVECYLCAIQIVSAALNDDFHEEEACYDCYVRAIKRSFVLQNSPNSELARSSKELWNKGAALLSQGDGGRDVLVNLTMGIISSELFKEKALLSPEILASRAHALTHSASIGEQGRDSIYQRVLDKANWKLREQSPRHVSFGVLPIVRLLLFVFTLMDLDGPAVVIGNRFWLIEYLVGAYEAAMMFKEGHFASVDLMRKHVHTRRLCKKNFESFISFGSNKCLRAWECCLSRLEFDEIMDFCDTTLCFWKMVFLPELISIGQPSAERWRMLMDKKSSLSSDKSRTIADHILYFVAMSDDYPYTAQNLLGIYTIPESMLEELLQFYNEGNEVDLYLLSLLLSRTHGKQQSVGSSEEAKTELVHAITRDLVRFGLTYIGENFESLSESESSYALLFIHVLLSQVRPKDVVPLLCGLLHTFLCVPDYKDNLMVTSILVEILSDEEYATMSRAQPDYNFVSLAKIHLESFMGHILHVERLETMLILLSDAMRLHSLIEDGRKERNVLIEEIAYKVGIFTLSLREESLILRSPIIKQAEKVFEYVLELEDAGELSPDSSLKQNDALDFLFSPLFATQRMAYSIFSSIAKKEGKLPEGYYQMLWGLREVSGEHVGEHVNVGILLVISLLVREYLPGLNRIELLSTISDYSKNIVQNSVLSILFSVFQEFLPVELFQKKHSKQASFDKILDSMRTEVGSLMINYASTLESQDDIERETVVEVCRQRSGPLLALQVVIGTLTYFPRTISEWWNWREGEIKMNIQRFMESLGSRLLVLSLFRSLTLREYEIEAGQILKQNESLVIQAYESDLLLVATYARDEIKLRLNVEFGNDFPFSSPRVSCRELVRKEAVFIQNNDARWRKWVLMVQGSILKSQGSILNTVLLWAQNVSMKMDKVEECPICYSIVHFSDRKTPDITCSRCSKVFHKKCLYRWFSTSYKSDCPMCRYPMQIGERFRS